MSLPNPGMDAVPFTTLPASFLDQIIANVEALATGSGLNTNAISAVKLATNAICLGYQPITTTFSTSSTSDVQVTGLSAAVTIPSGGRKVKITVYVPQAGSTNSNVTQTISLWDGTVTTGTLLQTAANSSSAVLGLRPTSLISVVTPSAGAKTYNVSVRTSGPAVDMVAAPAAPAFILVETI
jgi:hypothetical protein